jgi:hypothetical protein
MSSGSVMLYAVKSDAAMIQRVSLAITDDDELDI